MFSAPFYLEGRVYAPPPYAELAQLVVAPALYSGGHEFESHIQLQFTYQRKEFRFE